MMSTTKKSLPLVRKLLYHHKNYVRNSSLQLSTINKKGMMLPSPLLPCKTIVSRSFTASNEDLPFVPSSDFYEYEENIESMTNVELADPTTIPGFTTFIHSPPTKKDFSDTDVIPHTALVGKVVSTKMDKTINVAVDRYKVLRKYRKRVKYTRKFMAHDETEVCNEGDLVMIVPCQKLSKFKHFRVYEILKTKGQL